MRTWRTSSRPGSRAFSSRCPCSISSRGRRADGTLRLWRSSPADSGRSSYGEGWIHVAADDTLRHPLIGITDVDFLRTHEDPEALVEEKGRPSNPIYPQVLASRWTGNGRIALLVDTVANRHPDVLSLDGGGSALSVDWREDGTLGGTYARYGILTSDHAEGRWCARLLRSRPGRRTGGRE